MLWALRILRRRRFLIDGREVNGCGARRAQDLSVARMRKLRQDGAAEPGRVFEP